MGENYGDTPAHCFHETMAKIIAIIAIEDIRSTDKISHKWALGIEKNLIWRPYLFDMPRVENRHPVCHFFGLNEIMGYVDRSDAQLFMIPLQFKPQILGGSYIKASHGLIFSETILLMLVDKCLTREDAYAMVQRNAMKAWEEGIDFKNVLLQDTDIRKHLNQDELEGAFSIDRALRWVDAIFERVFY